jgi:hypothetical protein
MLSHDVFHTVCKKNKIVAFDPRPCFSNKPTHGENCATASLQNVLGLFGKDAGDAVSFLRFIFRKYFLAGGDWKNWEKSVKLPRRYDHCREPRVATMLRKSAENAETLSCNACGPFPQ